MNPYISELLAQLEAHERVVFWLEDEDGNHQEIDLTEVHYSPSENEVRCYFGFA